MRARPRWSRPCSITAGATPRLGRVDEGTTITDYDEEEIARSMSISAGLAYVRVGQDEDQPDRYARLQHVRPRSQDGAAGGRRRAGGGRWRSGVEVVTEKIWEYCDEFGCPAPSCAPAWIAIAPTPTRVLESLTNAFGRTVGSGAVADRHGEELHRRRRPGEDEGLHLRHGRKRQRQGDRFPPIWPTKPQAAHETLVELVAEGDDALMEEFFEKGTIREDTSFRHCTTPFAKTKSFPCSLPPAWATSAPTRCWTSSSTTCRRRPSMRRCRAEAAAPNNGEPPERTSRDTEPVSLYVFKTISDPFAGRISFFKVFSGVLKNDATVQNFTRNSAKSWRISP